MKYRSLFGAAILTTFFFASESKAQTYSAGSLAMGRVRTQVKNSGFKPNPRANWVKENQ